MSNWIKIVPLEDIPRAGSRIVKRTNGECNIAVFRSANDNVFALDDKCPHKGGPLSQGIVYEDKVACPLHSWKICMSDGNVEAPDTGCVPKYETKVEDGVVYIAL